MRPELPCAGTRGSVLVEALVALVIFMVGTAASVSLLRTSMAALTRAELESRVVPGVIGIPVRASEMPDGEFETPEGRLRWRTGPGALEVEFERREDAAATLEWRLPFEPLP